MAAPSLRSLLAGSAVDVAPCLLGAIIRHTTSEGTVAVRLTEVEAYLGAEDPGSHAVKGQTARNSVMFGDAGQLYTYFTYGMHVCANVVTGVRGDGAAILFRAGEVISGLDLARARRPAAKTDRDLARGPARLVVSLGIGLADGGADVLSDPFSLALAAGPVGRYRSGPRTGVSGAGGTSKYPWRFWLEGEPTVSPYRAVSGP